MKKSDFLVYLSLVKLADSAKLRDFCSGRKTETLKPFELKKLELKLQECAREKIKIITAFDRDYPKLLKEIPDYPPVIYCRGNQKLLNARVLIAMVGSRRATSYGLSVAGQFAGSIARAGAVVVSGLALGIDAACHRGVLAVGGKTIAVLGTAINYFYPRANEALGRQIIKSSGLVISEYPPGSPTSKFNFPMRNRIIAGLSRATIVVEAARNSGALITANLALDYNRLLYAVPGDVGRLNSQGTNNLISEGAICLNSPQVVVEDFNLKSPIEKIGLKPIEAKIVGMIKQGIDGFDRIVTKSKISPSELNAVLASLEIKGIVKRTADNKLRFDIQKK